MLKFAPNSLLMSDQRMNSFAIFANFIFKDKFSIFSDGAYEHRLDEFVGGIDQNIEKPGINKAFVTSNEVFVVISFGFPEMLHANFLILDMNCGEIVFLSFFTKIDLMVNPFF